MKLKNKAKTAAVFLAAIMAAGCGQNVSIDEAVESTVQSMAESAVTGILAAEEDEITVSLEEAPFSVTMLDVGQGLSILVQADGEYLLYDGGDRDTSSYVVSYLKAQGVSDLTYLTASHYDSDHIAGLVGVLNTADVETALVPDYEADSSIYASFMSALSDEECTIIYPSQGDTYSLGSAEILVVGPVSYDYEDENDSSVCLKITYGDFSVIMCGDAGDEAEEDMLLSGFDLSADLYIVSHHGSAYSGNDEFMEAVDPDYAFLSCGEDNQYGHPAQDTLDTLLYYDVDLWRSDAQGEVTAYSDGTDVWFSCDPTDDWTAGSSSSESESDYEGDGYVLNTNTMKFHYESCSAVSSMSEKNKEYTDLSRDEIIKLGYSACGICNP